MPLGKTNVSDINPWLALEVGSLDPRGIPTIAISKTMLTCDLLNQKEKSIYVD
jgi:hypothetical protein